MFVHVSYELAQMMSNCVYNWVLNQNLAASFSRSSKIEDFHFRRQSIDPDSDLTRLYSDNYFHVFLWSLDINGKKYSFVSVDSMDTLLKAPAPYCILWIHQRAHIQWMLYVSLQNDTIRKVVCTLERVSIEFTAYFCTFHSDKCVYYKYML